MYRVVWPDNRVAERDTAEEALRAAEIDSVEARREMKLFGVVEQEGIVVVHVAP